MIAIVLGTRPEIIKMSPIIRECENTGSDYFILHTGQHYSYELDKIFFEELELPQPKYNLDVGSGTHAEQTGRIMTGIEKILVGLHPDKILGCCLAIYLRFNDWKKPYVVGILGITVETFCDFIPCRSNTI